MIYQDDDPDIIVDDTTNPDGNPDPDPRTPTGDPDDRREYCQDDEPSKTDDDGLDDDGEDTGYYDWRDEWVDNRDEVGDEEHPNP